MNKHINNLLASTAGTAADMTHNLCLAGGGDMRVGIRNLWIDGCGTGTIATTAILGCGFMVYRLVSKKYRTLKKVEIIDTAFNKGYELGRQQERGFQEYLREKGYVSDDSEENETAQIDIRDAHDD